MTRLQLCMLKQICHCRLTPFEKCQVHLSHLSFANQVLALAQVHLFSDVHMRNKINASTSQYEETVIFHFNYFCASAYICILIACSSMCLYHTCELLISFISQWLL